MTAQEFTDQAAEVAPKMEPGTWEAVQALALAVGRAEPGLDRRPRLPADAVARVAANGTVLPR